MLVNFRRRAFEKEGVEMREKHHDMISVAKHELSHGMLGVRWFQVFAKIDGPKEHTHKVKIPLSTIVFCSNFD